MGLEVNYNMPKAEGIMACDICGQSGKSLYNILESFQTPEIKDVCNDCLKRVEEYKSKSLSAAIDAMTVDVKRYMETQRMANR